MTDNHNVDPNEIKKFADLASRWWDYDGEFKPLHDINPLRLDYICQHSRGLFGKQILDIGCGGGILSESMAKQEAQVLGIDMGVEPLTVAKLHALETGIESVKYQQISAEAQASANPNSFDIVTCMEMLEHVPNPRSVVEACSQLVKPNGQVFFSTINKNLKAWAMAIIGAEMILKLVPKGTHNFDKFIKPSQLISWAEACGLKVRDIIGLHYNPFTKSFQLGPNIDVNYMVFCEKIG